MINTKGLCLMIAFASVAVAPVYAELRITEYTPARPAQYDAAADEILCPAKGYFVVRATQPITAINAKVFTQRLSKVIIESRDATLAQVPVGTTDFNVAIALDKPVNEIKFVVWGECRLRNASVKLADGSTSPLWIAFFEGHEKLRPAGLPSWSPTAEEPPTRALAADAARRLVMEDWQAQLGRQEVAVACRNELERMRRILDRQAGRRSAAEMSKWTQTIASLAEELKTSGAAGPGMYEKIRDAKRRMSLSDPLIDFEEIVAIDNDFASPHQTTHRNNHGTRGGRGGRLLVIEGLGPQANVHKLAPTGSEAVFLRPDVSFDGQRILYSMRREGREAYHLHEMGLDGSGPRQITFGDYDHIDPIYAPDGSLIFSTIRCNQHLPCGGWPHQMFILARSDADGRNVYFISANHECDYTPSFLADGRILYTRWEYYDKSVSRIQSLWTVNPDGTQPNTHWGNQSRWPDMLLHAREIPGTRRILFSAPGHHQPYDGPLGIVDQSEGRNYPDGLYNLTPDVPWAEVGKGPADRPWNNEFHAPECYKGFTTPFPLNEQLMLVSARRGREVRVFDDPEATWYSLYLMDFDGNMELLYSGAFNILHAQPVRPRPVPRVIPTMTKWPGRMTRPDQKADPGILFSANVYANSGIPVGKAKYLRVWESEARTYGSGDIVLTFNQAKLYKEKQNFPTGDIVGSHASLLYADSPKRILTTVPVESDGSVNLKVPSACTIYFQLLDERGRCLQTMRSAVNLMPGEYRGCLGCHETMAATPPAVAGTIALRRQPSSITPPPWRDATVSFPRFVQPILDRHCVACHGGDKPAGSLNLTHRTEPGAVMFSWPYIHLVFGSKLGGTYSEVPKKSLANPLFPALTYQNPNARFPTQETVVPPMTALSYNSPLLEIMTSGKHHNVKVDAQEGAMIIAWIDALTPYWGAEEFLAQPDPDPAKFRNYLYPPLSATAPIVHRAFMQDDFLTQNDRIPKGADGKPLPSVYWEDNRRFFRIPSNKQSP